MLHGQQKCRLCTHTVGPAVPHTCYCALLDKYIVDFSALYASMTGVQQADFAKARSQPVQAWVVMPEVSTQLVVHSRGATIAHQPIPVLPQADYMPDAHAALQQRRFMSSALYICGSSLGATAGLGAFTLTGLSATPEPAANAVVPPHQGAAVPRQQRHYVCLYTGPSADGAPSGQCSNAAQRGGRQKRVIGCAILLRSTVLLTPCSGCSLPAGEYISSFEFLDAHGDVARRDARHQGGVALLLNCSHVAPNCQTRIEEGPDAAMFITIHARAAAPPLAELFYSYNKRPTCSVRCCCGCQGYL